MADKKSYTAVEWLMITIIAPIVTAGVVALMIPLGLLSAWIRVQFWNWFIIPYFHAPSISVWLMFVIGMFIGLFMPTIPDLKPELYTQGAIGRMTSYFAGQLIFLAVGYILHVTVLKG